MPHSPSAFGRLIKQLDRRIVARAVSTHGGDHGVGCGDNAWTCERHLKALVFGQLAGLDSLREITTALAAQPQALYHLNLRAPRRSTLADANANRPAAVFRDIAEALMAQAGTLRREGMALIRLLDSTPIPLKGRGFDWVAGNARTHGLKIHLLYDPHQGRPVWLDVTDARVDDVVAGRAVPLEAGAIYVFDKGYTDYTWWSRIVSTGAVFVTRRKRNARRRDIVERLPEGPDILADRTFGIGHKQPRGGARNPLYHLTLREIVVRRPDAAEPFALVTNDLHRPAQEIAALYKQRWDIELLFKWLKQNLDIRHFLGRSDNAVRLQIYAAIIAFLLLRLFHDTVARGFHDSTTLLLAHLKTNLFGRFRIPSPATPPPQPPGPRPPNPQTCLAFP